MNKLEIKEPDWINMAGDMFTDRLKLIEPDLHCWFKSEVAPINKLFREGVEVFFRKGNLDNEALYMFTTPNKNGEMIRTHKALLINIQPIKQKTREEKAMELLEEIYNENISNEDGTIEHYWWKKVKELLESKDE